MRHETESIQTSVGNDVVDLAHPRCRGKAADRRFLDRVFTPEERERILGHPEPDLALWLRWAAKEAAFKVVSKALGAPPVFEHRAFRVEGDEDGRSGVVLYREEPVRWRVDGEVPEPGCLHVLAWGGSGSGAADGPPRIHRGVARLEAGSGIPGDRFDPAELAGVRTEASAWVRIHARAHLASLAGVPEAAVRIVSEGGVPGRTPPRARIDGETAPWDVSLSHHGRWLGWALRAPTGAAGS